jgi:hypothetical protein
MSLKLVNAVGMPGPAGFGQLELWHGNLFDWAAQNHPDVICVAAHPGDIACIQPGEPCSEPYMWAQLLRMGVNLRALREASKLRLEYALNLWISEPIESPFRCRIVCLQHIGDGTEEIHRSFANLFAALSVLEALSQPVGTVAMPLLGAGGFQRPADVVSEALLLATRGSLGRLVSLLRVAVVERDPKRLGAFSAAFDRQLGRPRKGLSESRIFPLIRQELNNLVARARHIDKDVEVLAELAEVVQQPEPSASLIATTGRKFAEHIAERFGGRGKNLAERIEDLRNHEVPRWIVGYLHVLRQLGNELMHYQSAGQHRLDHEDLAATLLCLMRILDFLTIRSASGASASRSVHGES